MPWLSLDGKEQQRLGAGQQPGKVAVAKTDAGNMADGQPEGLQ
ncbi:hypothetical protein [Robinsoniella peoriensis]|nr:hypothetical protein [Robinsoniella peoriensis]